MNRAETQLSAFLLARIEWQLEQISEDESQRTAVVDDGHQMVSPLWVSKQHLTNKGRAS